MPAYACSKSFATRSATGSAPAGYQTTLPSRRASATCGPCAQPGVPVSSTTTAATTRQHSGTWPRAGRNDSGSSAGSDGAILSWGEVSEGGRSPPPSNSRTEELDEPALDLFVALLLLLRISVEELQL